MLRQTFASAFVIALLSTAASAQQTPREPARSPVRLLPNYVASEEPKDAPLERDAPAAPVPMPLPARSDALQPWEHLMIAADHLEAGGLPDEAQELRERARRQSEDQQRLAQKLKELEKLQAEINELHRRLGTSQQIEIRVKIIEFSEERLRAAGMELPGIEPGATPGALGVAGCAEGRIIRDPASTLKMIEELKQKGLIRILAEPAIITTSGRPAHLVSGGEFPVPVSDGSGETRMQWREFGVRMEACATIIAGRRLRLEIQPEIAEPNFADAVSVAGTGGWKVPAITSRRINTQVEMNAGEMLLVSGLRSDRPIKQVAGAQENGTTEMWVLVTAEFVQGLMPQP
jgi:hypothetical protein